jgi:hypothetical protein
MLYNNKIILRLFLCCACLLLPISLLWSQNYTFKVLAIKGKITADGQVLQVGSEVKSNQTVSIEEDSCYIALYYAGKKDILELTKKGNYAGQDLVKQVNALKGWENDFFYYALGELSQEVTFIQNPNRRPTTPLIALLPTTEQKMYGRRLLFRWFVLDQLPTKESIVEFQIFVYDLKENILYLNSTKKNYMSLELGSQKFLSQPAILIQIIPSDGKGKDLAKGYKSEMYRIGRVEEEKVKMIDKELDELFKDRNKDTAFSKLAEARYFEDKKLPLDAMQAFEQAISLSFNAEAYKKTYRFFLERQGYPSGIIDK